MVSDGSSRASKASFDLPETVDGPRVIRARGGVRVPELSEEDLAARGVEAARVLVHGRVLAAQRDVRGASDRVERQSAAGCRCSGEERSGDHAGTACESRVVKQEGRQVCGRCAVLVPLPYTQDTPACFAEDRRAICIPCRCQTCRGVPISDDKSRGEVGVRR